MHNKHLTPVPRAYALLTITGMDRPRCRRPPGNSSGRVVRSHARGPYASSGADRRSRGHAALGITTDARQTPPPARGLPSNARRVTRTAPPMSVIAQNELVGKYCATCHSARAKAGGLVLAGFDAMKAIENGELTEKMIRKLRARMMPPAGAARPDDATVMAMVDTLEGVMDKHAAANPRPGWRPFQRLNRAEYAAAVNDLIGLDVDVNAWLPPDTISDGYDNVADVQNFSSQLMQGYLRAASQISRLAIGDRNASATSVTFKVEHSRSQMVRAAGAPIGTRGGISIVHVFPSDGEYVIKASMIYAALGGLFGRTPLLAMGFVEQLDVSINGERVALLDILPTMTETDFGQNKGQNGMEVRTPPIHIKAGPQRISAAFIQRLEGPADDLLAPVENTAEGGDGYGTITLPHMRDMTIVGPSKVTGVSETVSRKKIFSCRPTSAAEEEACAAKILRDLTTRAYRGKGGAAGLQDAMKFYEMGRQGLAAPKLGSDQRAEAGTSRAASAWRCSPSSSARASSSAWKAARRPKRPPAPIAWRISISPRACRSSSGARGRTRS